MSLPGPEIEYEEGLEDGGYQDGEHNGGDVVMVAAEAEDA
jgi:hypothetical protein